MIIVLVTAPTMAMAPTMKLSTITVTQLSMKPLPTAHRFVMPTTLTMVQTTVTAPKILLLKCATQPKRTPAFI